MSLAGIGIGSNLGDARANVERALAALHALGRVTARSALYRSKAWGVSEQPDFVNAAALLETLLEPPTLLRELQAIERQLGRTATFRWGPRLIDLDILTYAGREIRSPELTVPHERLFERAFALGPLAEIDPSFAAAFEALPRTEREGLERIGS